MKKGKFFESDYEVALIDLLEQQGLDIYLWW